MSSFFWPSIGGACFPDSTKEDLFPSRQGWPSVPAPVNGSVLVLQALQGLSDRETAEDLTYDLRWKAACGYGLTDTAFHLSTLTYWRRHLAGDTDASSFSRAFISAFGQAPAEYRYSFSPEVTAEN